MFAPVVGLEIHLQVKTKSKMFCRCRSAYFNEQPNTHVCEVCFGLPGALPMVNKAAIEKCISLALALHCKINQNTKFDRKNYFYPDLPKGYQISQFDHPIGEEGYVEIEVGDDSRRIRIQTVHIEEDAGKSIHAENETLIDYNKSGVALIEMVTYPDFESVEEVLAFAKRLRQIVRYNNISDAEMQKGQMRFELNISVKTEDTDKLPNYKVEVKNIGSISVLEKVMQFEIKRQSELLEKGEEIKTQTRGLKDMTGETLFQRLKEGSDDYRYFPEPDIPPIYISDDVINQIQVLMPEQPVERKLRYLSYGLNPEQAEIFVEDIERGKYFDFMIEELRQSGQTQNSLLKDFAKWINTEIAGLLIKDAKDFSECAIKPSDLITIVSMVKEAKISGTSGKQILEELYKGSSSSAQEIINEKGLLQIEDSSEVESLVEKVIKENAKVVEDVSKNPNAIKFLVGQVMRLSKGRANAQRVEEILSERFKS